MSIVNCIDKVEWKTTVKTNYDAWKRTAFAKTYWKYREGDNVEATDTESVMTSPTATTTTTIAHVGQIKSTIKMLEEEESFSNFQNHVLLGCLDTEKLTMETQAFFWCHQTTTQA